MLAEEPPFDASTTLARRARSADEREQPLGQCAGRSCVEPGDPQPPRHVVGHDVGDGREPSGLELVAHPVGRVGVRGRPSGCCGSRARCRRERAWREPPDGATPSASEMLPKTPISISTSTGSRSAYVVGPASPVRTSTTTAAVAAARARRQPARGRARPGTASTSRSVSARTGIRSRASPEQRLSTRARPGAASSAVARRALTSSKRRETGESGSS